MFCLDVVRARSCLEKCGDVVMRLAVCDVSVEVVVRLKLGSWSSMVNIVVVCEAW